MNNQTIANLPIWVAPLGVVLAAVIAVLGQWAGEWLRHKRASKDSVEANALALAVATQQAEVHRAEQIDQRIQWYINMVDEKLRSLEVEVLERDNRIQRLEEAGRQQEKDLRRLQEVESRLLTENEQLRSTNNRQQQEIEQLKIQVLAAMRS